MTRLFARLRRRIIPARAGFTQTSQPPLRRGGDHPRSRGVYSIRSNRTITPGGSSPLARGLLGRSSLDDVRHRIIPARAGFTPIAWPKSGSPRDHPRSRGVYAQNTTRSIGYGGSSPLARGLPPRPTAPGSSGGIIPARAGFTVGLSRLRSLRSDHPRSRGVYNEWEPSRDAALGSSPLARGLPIGFT